MKAKRIFSREAVCGHSESKGQVQLTITGATAVLQHVQAGTLRALGVTTLKRIRVAPDIPAIDETLPGFEASQWYGIVTPAHTPAAILKRLEEEIRKAMHLPDVLARLDTEGVEPWEVTPEEFRNHGDRNTAGGKKAAPVHHVRFRMAANGLAGKNSLRFHRNRP